MGNITYRSFSGVMYGIIHFTLSFLQNILIVPFILSKWGSENYGIWIASYAFISIMRTLDSGHQLYLGNEYIKLFYLDVDKAKKLLASGIKIAMLIGLLEFAIFFSIIYFNSEKLFIGVSTNYILNWGLGFMFFVWFLVGSAGGIIHRIILAFGLFNRSVFWSIVYKLLEVSLLLVAVLKNWSVGFTFIVLAAILFIYSIVVLIDIKNKVPSIYPWWVNGSIKEGFRSFKLSLLITLNGFVDQFNLNGMLILIGNILTASTIPIYSTLKTFSNIFIQINQIVLNPLLPDFIKYHTINEKSKINDILNINWFLLNFILIIPILLILPYTKDLYEWWTQGKLQFDILLSNFLFLSVIIISYGKIMMFYLSGINHLKALLITNIFRVIILFTLTIIFLFKAKSLSFIGFSICISEFFASLLIPFYFVKKELKETFNSISILIVIGIVLGATIFIMLESFEFKNDFFSVKLLILFVFISMVFYQYRMISKRLNLLFSQILSSFK